MGKVSDQRLGTRCFTLCLSSITPYARNFLPAVSQNVALYPSHNKPLFLTGTCVPSGHQCHYYYPSSHHLAVVLDKSDRVMFTYAIISRKKRYYSSKYRRNKWRRSSQWGKPSHNTTPFMHAFIQHTMHCGFPWLQHFGHWINSRLGDSQRRVYCCFSNFASQHNMWHLSSSAVCLYHYVTCCPQLYIYLDTCFLWWSYAWKPLHRKGCSIPLIMSGQQADCMNGGVYVWVMRQIQQSCCAHGH